MRFRADQHLRRESDFNYVRTHGRRFDCGAFVFFYASRPTPEVSSTAITPLPQPAPARAGFVASRSAVGNAVARARAKRRLREKFRAHQRAFPAGLDFIFVARRALNGLEPAGLELKFLELCRKLFPPRAP